MQILAERDLWYQELKYRLGKAMKHEIHNLENEFQRDTATQEKKTDRHFEVKEQSVGKLGVLK